MIKLNIICVGKIKEKYITMGIDEFSKRLTRYVKLSIIELPEENDNLNIELAVEKETDRIIQYIQKKSFTGIYNILLDLKGLEQTSEDMAKKIDKLSLTNSEINFIIGGSNGVSDKLRAVVDFRLAFSHFTFPHQLMRLILLEQLYRWVSINKNIKYHK